MRGFLKSVMAFGLVALISGPAMAQQRGGGGGGYGQGGVMLISNPSVQKELKLDDAQVEKAKEAGTAFQEKRRESMSSLEGLEGDELMKKRQEVNMALNAEGMKALTTFLKPEQVKRFKQIEIQIAGINALSMPEVAKALKVTDAQKEKVTALLADQRSQMQDAQEAANGDRQAIMQKSQVIRKETNTKAMALMTDDQKKTWKELTGEPFEMIQAPRPAR